MSANLSSDKADRSRFRLSRVPNVNFGNDTTFPHVHDGVDQVVNALFLVCPTISAPSHFVELNQVI